MIVTRDYKGNPVREGDFARSIESGWVGKIVGFSDDIYKVDDRRWHWGIMCKMVGVDEIAMMAGGLTPSEAISDDDTAWYSPSDLLVIR